MERKIIMKKIKLLRKQFGVWFTLISMLTFLLRKVNSDSYIYHLFHKYKYSIVNSYIEKKYQNIIMKYKEKSENKEEKITEIIWIFWWQGIENAPIIVKKCVDKIEKIGGNIVFIDKNNYGNYINVSPEILKKLNNEEFTLTYFSDIIRFSLLAKYGGLWIDPTCYITELPKLKDENFITIKHNLFNTWHVSRGRWSGFFIGCSKNNPAICLIRDILLNNALDTCSLMAYLFIDSAMSVAYDNLPNFKNEVDKLKISNVGVFKMEKQLDELYNENYSIPEKINKLSYKTKHSVLRNDQLTIYGALIENKL